MQELKTLLNTLIAKGRNPWGGLNVEIEKNGYGFRFSSPLIGIFKSYCDRSLRDIASLDSGLRQFVCENKLQNQKHSEGFNGLGIKVYNEGCDARVGVYPQCYEYRLLESAITPERDLAKFLVDNIVIEGNSK